jgi:tetratricopeptide (TPR) repeat protein
MHPAEPSLREMEFQRVLAAMGRGNACINIVGGIGSGKSTLLAHLSTEAKQRGYLLEDGASKRANKAPRVFATARAARAPRVTIVRLAPVADAVANAWLTDRIVRLGGPVVDASLVLSHLYGIPLLLELAARRLVATPVAQLADALVNQPGLLLDDDKHALRRKVLRATKACTAAELLTLRRLAQYCNGASMVELEAEAEVVASLVEQRFTEQSASLVRALAFVTVVVREQTPVALTRKLEHKHAEAVLARAGSSHANELRRVAERAAHNSALLSYGLRAATEIRDADLLRQLLTQAKRLATDIDTHALALTTLAELRPDHATEALERALTLRASPRVMIELGLALQRSGNLERAGERYQAALASAALEPSLRARATLNLGTIFHDEVRLEEARLAYEASLPLAEGRVLGAAWLNLGVLHHEQGALSQAEHSLERAARVFADNKETRLQGIALTSLGAVRHERGDVNDAVADHLRGQTLLAESGDVRSQGLCEVRLSIALADTKQLRAAGDALGRAEGYLLLGSDPGARRVLELGTTYVGVVSQRAGFAEHAERTLDDVRLDGTRAPTTDDSRFVARLLRRALTVSPRPSTGPTLERDSKSLVTPRGERHSFEKHPHAWRILLALASSEANLSLEDLWIAGWPNEQAAHGAWQNRVYVALSLLRKLGLREWLRRDEQGYRLEMKTPP